MNPTHTFNVDLTNPGQFFACCGLLELANAVNTEAITWFSETQFHTSFDPAEILKRFCELSIATREMGPPEFGGRCASASLPKSSTTIDPIIVGPPFDLIIDWWLLPRGATVFKTWSGDKQVPKAILNGLIAAVIAIIEVAESREQNVMEALLTTRSRLTLSPFYYDGIVSRNPLDMGYYIESRMELRHCAIVELLTFMAIQRFEPKQLPDGEFSYRAWLKPLSADIAAAASFGLLESIPTQKFLFAVTPRDDYHEQFSPARRSHV